MFAHIGNAIVYTADAAKWLTFDLIVARILFAVGRFAIMPRPAKRNYPAALWHRLRWRWLTRNLGLAYEDKHRRTVGIPATTAATVTTRTQRPKLRYPRASFRADNYGLTVRMRTIPGTGREQVEKNAPHIADAWRCHRISVTQPRPGRLVLRGLRTDPLADPLHASELPRFDGRHVCLGRDDFGTLRRASLANHAGSCWAGNPGRGKTECALSLAVQLASSPLVDVHVLDGGACDWAHFAEGAASYVADDLEAAEQLLADLDRKMTQRRRSLEEDLGVRNAWQVGPTAEYRLQWVLVEEAPFYLSLDAVKGDGKKEKQVAKCRGFLSGLLMRGRAPMFHTSLMSQKPTSTSLPTQLRDLCGLRWCFGVSTTDTAVAALGDDIRQYESLSPVQLQGDEHVGIAAALLATGGNPYTLLRFPAVGEDLADTVARQLADRRQPDQPAAKLHLVS